ncbi:MAG: aspartate--tRNA ligase [Simkaniaceae bacterium]|nr:aspartate--tRNA ligase [Simkaniaceae bacterium]
MHYCRTHTCQDLNLSHVAHSVTLSGWVHRRRDHGGLIFIDLRDRFGITQLVLDPKKHPDAHTIRSEWVISVSGIVLKREAEAISHKLKTGEIEIEVKQLYILSKAHTPPFTIADDHSDEVNEELRLKFRYLDIRRGKISDNLVKRHEAMLSIRNFLAAHNFLEITTPILAKSTPEGARDYLVPSRVHPGSFYALPQSPQIFKQLLMVSGMDRYFQFATCFRDEDLRADRQPEFMQIDIELSFATPQTLYSLIEDLICSLFGKHPFRRLSYAECLETYGTDKPDLRFKMPLFCLRDLAKTSQFTVFQEAPCVKGLCIKGGASFSRGDIEKYTAVATHLGLPGLAWMKFQEGALNSNIVKFFNEDEQRKICTLSQAEEGDLLFFAASDEKKVNQVLDHLRRKLACDLNLIEDSYQFLWVDHFPLFEYDAEKEGLSSMHHPFTMPHPEDLPLLDTDPLKVRANAYDLVLNGYEIGGGSERIYNPELQSKIFSLLSLSPEQIQEKFGFFVEALKYGTPPHLGMALGFDRLMMLLCNTDNIRDVIAFPKTQKAADLMTDCPSGVSRNQLFELHLLK